MARLRSRLLLPPAPGDRSGDVLVDVDEFFGERIPGVGGTDLLVGADAAAAGLVGVLGGVGERYGESPPDPGPTTCNSTRTRPSRDVSRSKMTPWGWRRKAPPRDPLSRPSDTQGFATQSANDGRARSDFGSRIGDLAYLALRKSAGCDGGEQLPVGSASVEECADSVVAEPAEPEGDAFDPLDEVVHRFGRSVRDA